MKIGYAGLILLLAGTLSSWAVGVPDSFNYQGVLLDGTGGALPAGTKSVRFQLYETAFDTNALWSRTASVLLDSNGLFNVTLEDGMGGGGSGTLAGVMASNETLFLGLRVDSNNEISPRQQLLAVPFALKAGDVSEASGDFTVGGSLMAQDGAEIQGEVQADSLQIGANRLTTNSAGNGNLTINGNVDVAEELHVMQNLAADGNTTLSNLTVNGTLVAEKGVLIGGTTDYAAAGVEDLRIVRGSIYCTSLSNPDMSRSHGSGWSVGNPETGKYTVTFTNPFSDVPTVIVTPWSTILQHQCIITYLTNTYFEAETYDSGDNLKALSFHFMAIGPR